MPIDGRNQDREGGTATAGHYGVAMADDNGTAVTGIYGTSTAGDGGTAIAGPYGEAAAGKGGVIQLRWFDKTANRPRLAVGYIGEGGLLPGVLYRLNDEHQFEPVP